MSDSKTSNTSVEVPTGSSDKPGLASKMAPVTEQERQLTLQAKSEFDKGNHDACIAALGMNRLGWNRSSIEDVRL